MTLPATDQALRQALGRLLAGTPTRTTGGCITVRSLCAEAAVSTDSFYRSTIRGELKAAIANADARQPEIGRLREELKDARAEITALKAAHRQEMNEATATVNAFANQIQVLALENQNLRNRGSGANVAVLKVVGR